LIEVSSNPQPAVARGQSKNIREIQVRQEIAPIVAGSPVHALDLSVALRTQVFLQIHKLIARPQGFKRKAFNRFQHHGPP
jgi:hypothetical protein